MTRRQLALTAIPAAVLVGGSLASAQNTGSGLTTLVTGSGPQFVDEPVAIGVNARTEPLLGLNSVMVIKRIIRELPQGDDVSRLMKRPNDQGRRRSA